MASCFEKKRSTGIYHDKCFHGELIENLIQDTQVLIEELTSTIFNLKVLLDIFPDSDTGEFY
jgi:hypothetical protein